MFMTDEASVQRRLTAILAADVVGYSRPMGVDEVGTLRPLKAARRWAVMRVLGHIRGARGVL
jgi:class 3 adenylate cyclase